MTEKQPDPEAGDDNDDNDDAPAEPPVLHDPITREPAVRTLRSEALFAGTRRIAIEHNGQLYQLRITSNGKLILTK